MPRLWEKTTQARRRRRTCDQHNRGDMSVRIVGTTNPQQIEVMEFALYSRRFVDDYSRQYVQSFRTP